MDHPVRAIRALVDEILRERSRDFSRLSAMTGRPSVPLCDDLSLTLEEIAGLLECDGAAPCS